MLGTLSAKFEHVVSRYQDRRIFDVVERITMLLKDLPQAPTDRQRRYAMAYFSLMLFPIFMFSLLHVFPLVYLASLPTSYPDYPDLTVQTIPFYLVERQNALEASRTGGRLSMSP